MAATCDCREMTLVEWCERLGKRHLVNKQLTQIRNALRFYVDGEWDSMSSSVYADEGKRADEALALIQEVDHARD